MTLASPSLSRRGLLLLGGGSLAFGAAAIARPAAAAETVLAEAVSRYNRIRVAESGTVRTMYFVGDDGTQFIESRHDRSRPQSLDLDYTRTMMAGFLLQPRPRRLLMLGLGGGGMSNYLKARFPELEIDAVDIDPEVVRLAQEFFDVPKDDPRYRVHVADARLFVERAAADVRWDMIMLDAFRGVFVPYHLKTAEFYRACLARLAPDGVVVANLHNVTRMYPHDRETTSAVFPSATASSARPATRPLWSPRPAASASGPTRSAPTPARSSPSSTPTCSASPPATTSAATGKTPPRCSRTILNRRSSRRRPAGTTRPA
ncbi:fused MFS/spermidine synthase [Nannocystis pusilla]|uniref:spermidine synthase n=1 Tax=Nannocystis pusilla TaxID=889268 RepID=UPI003B79BE6A